MTLWGVEVGSLADWFSGFASTAAVIVALWVALRDYKSRSEEKQEQAIRAAKIENAFIVEVLSAYQTIALEAEEALINFANGVAVDIQRWNYAIVRVREAALRFQQMPMIGIGGYQNLEGVIAFALEAADSVDFTDTSVEDELKNIMDRCAFQSEELEKMANPLAPLNW